MVDTTDFIDHKVHVNLANVTQGPAGNNRQELASQGRKLELGTDEETENRQYTKYFALGRDRVRGQAHGLQFAEVFHYVGPDEPDIGDYARKYAVPL